MSICKLCSRSEFKVLFDREFKVFLCKNCNLVFIDPENERDLKKYYTEEIDYDYTEDEKRNRSILKWIIHNIPRKKNMSIVEIGCGAAHLLKRLQQSGFRVFGIEPSIRAVEIAKSESGVSDIYNCMLDETKGLDNMFDCAILIQTFEHFPDPLKSLLKIKQLLKKKGIVFIEIPNFFSPIGFFREKVNGIHYPSQNHLFVYSKHTIKAFLKRAGFHLIKINVVFGNIRITAQADGKMTDYQINKESSFKVLLFYSILPVLKNTVDGLRVLKRKMKFW